MDDDFHMHGFMVLHPWQDRELASTIWAWQLENARDVVYIPDFLPIGQASNWPRGH